MQTLQSRQYSQALHFVRRRNTTNQAQFVCLRAACYPAVSLTCSVKAEYAIQRNLADNAVYRRDWSTPINADRQAATDCGLPSIAFVRRVNSLLPDPT
jgi:hypothetical protein